MVAESRRKLSEWLYDTGVVRDDYWHGYNTGLQWQMLVIHDPGNYSEDYQMGYWDARGDLENWELDSLQEDLQWLVEKVDLEGDLLH